MVVLSTARLTLRRLQRDELAPLFALYRDPDIRMYFPEKTLTLQETRDELEWFLDGHPENPQIGLWATIEKSSGSFLGRCGLLPWTIEGKQEVELAFLIDKRRWGEGFATEAARGIIDYAQDRLGVKRLICLIMPGNVASMRVAQRVGMTFERTYQDEFGDCEIWALPLG